MLSKTKLEEILSLCMHSEADLAEVYQEDELTETIRTLGEEVETVNRQQVAGIGIRLYKGDQTVYGFSNSEDDDKLLPIVRDLCVALGTKDEGKTVVLEERVVPNRHFALIDFETTPLEEKVALLTRAVRAAKETDERIVKVQTTLLNVKQTVRVANSDGLLKDDTRVRTRMMVNAYAQEGEKMQDGGASPGAGMGLELWGEPDPYAPGRQTIRPEDVGREAARQALVLLNAKDCPSGKMPVVIDNAFGGVIFHEACGHALEASAIALGQSVFCGKMGQQIASPVVSAVDDGTIPNAWGSQNMDDEGTPQRRRVLIENGILKSYMVDRLNGRRMGAESTGSSRRQSYKFEPTSRMSNTFICPGTDSFESLFEGIEKGLYAARMGGGSVNPTTGEFNFAVKEGYLIENGKVTVPVKGASLIGRGNEILMNIDKVSDNLARGQGMCGAASGSIPTDVGQPALRVSSITVGGTANE